MEAVGWICLSAVKLKKVELSLCSKMLSFCPPPHRVWEGGPKNWWLEKKVFYPPHLTLDKINATRDIDLSGVTKGFEKKRFENKSLFGEGFGFVEKRCNMFHS